MMNYKQLYDELMEFRKANVLSKGNHTELHHVMPKSIAPELKNDKNNLIRLTPAEHFKAHYYLMMHYRQVGDTVNCQKMGYAIHRMKSQIVEHLDDTTLEEISFLYQKVREAMPPMSQEQRDRLSKAKRGKKLNLTDEQRRRRAEVARQIHTGKKRSEESKRRMSESVQASGRCKGKRNGMYGKGYLLQGDRNGMYGKNHSEEAKRKMSQSRCRAVLVYDLDWNFICEFPCIYGKDGAQVNLGVNCIGRAITNNRPLNGYRFKYKKEYESQNISRRA